MYFILLQIDTNILHIIIKIKKKHLRKSSILKIKNIFYFTKHLQYKVHVYTYE